jgi:polyisoprenoid-binding protein YceI
MAPPTDPRRRVAGLVCALVLAGCAAEPDARAPLNAPAAPAAPSDLPAPSAPTPPGFPSAAYERAPRGDRVYRIAPGESQLDIFVRRGGRLARLGHNHIVTSRDVAGFVLDAADPARSRFDFYFPVATLVVDDPALRAEAGPDYASQPSENDIEGTRRNMLGERLLDAEAYPYVLVSGRIVRGSAEQPEVALTITIKGAAHDVRTTADVERDGTTLRASGELELSHAALGLEPFSVLGGAIAVEDAFRVRYRLVAHTN